MKIKLGEAVNSVESLNKLLKTSLPVKVAYKISKVTNKLEPELKIFNEQKNKIITKLGEEIDGQFTIKQTSANWAKFIEEVSKLEEVEVDLDFTIDGKQIEPIKIDDLGDISIEPADLVNLKWLIV